MVGEVPAERSLAGNGIIRSADLGQIEQPRVIQREGRKNYDFRRLKKFFAIGIDILDAGGASVLVQNTAHPASGPQFEIFVALEPIRIGDAFSRPWEGAACPLIHPASRFSLAVRKYAATESPTSSTSGKPTAISRSRSAMFVCNLDVAVSRCDFSPPT